jgi:hypothetical protein
LICCIVKRFRPSTGTMMTRSSFWAPSNSIMILHPNRDDDAS